MATTERNYRVISGWSYFEEFDSLEEARLRRNEMLGGDPVWERDALYTKPAIYVRNNETGNFHLTAVE